MPSDEYFHKILSRLDSLENANVQFRSELASLNNQESAPSLNSPPPKIQAEQKRAPLLGYNVGRAPDNISLAISEIKKDIDITPQKPNITAPPAKNNDVSPAFNAILNTALRSISLPIKGSYSLKLKDRFEHEMGAQDFHTNRINLPINTLGSFYEMPNSQRIFIHEGSGELSYADACMFLDFTPLRRFCMPLFDKSNSFAISTEFLTELDAFLRGVKKAYTSEVKKGIELFVFVLDKNAGKHKDYLRCEMVNAIDCALLKIQG